VPPPRTWNQAVAQFPERLTLTLQNWLQLQW
jgi:hypothetical protein